MLEPIYRIEFFLDAIVNNTTPPEPIYRAEFYLAKIAGADVEIPEPVYRMEKYLAKLCGEDVELPDPIYRMEFYLAAICGEDVEVPEPVFRIEYWLNEFQYIYELWRVPIGSLQYNGWSNQQLVDKSLDCLYSQNHKLR